MREEVFVKNLGVIIDKCVQEEAGLCLYCTVCTDGWP